VLPPELLLVPPEPVLPPELLLPPEQLPPQLESVSWMFEGVNDDAQVVEKLKPSDEPGRTDTLEVLEYVHVDPDCVWVQPES
jgi:hypothetical protein